MEYRPPGTPALAFDLAVDPGERQDLASTRPELVEAENRTLGKLLRLGPHIESGAREVPEVRPPEQLDALRSLGYVNRSPSALAETGSQDEVPWRWWS